MIKVLVVEDHSAIAQGLRENLELEGFEVRISGDGIDAIQVASSWMPDLVLLDLCCRSAADSTCWPRFAPVAPTCR